MFKQDDVLQKIGLENLRIIRNAIRRGIIKIDQIRAMARRMGGTVLGIFTEKENKERPVAVFDFMLDTWYEEVLCQPGIDGVKAIKKILSDEDVGLNSLAMKMVPLQSVDGKVPRDSEESLALPQKSSSLLTFINMRKEGDQGNLEQWKGTRINNIEFVVSTEPSQSSRLLSNQEDANPPGGNIFHDSWIIIREKFPFLNPFGKSLSFGVFTWFVMNCKKLTKLPC